MKTTPTDIKENEDEKVKVTKWSSTKTQKTLQTVVTRVTRLARFVTHHRFLCWYR